MINITRSTLLAEPFVPFGLPIDTTTLLYRISYMLVLWWSKKYLSILEIVCIVWWGRL